MSNQVAFSCVVFKQGSLTLLARIVDYDGQQLTQDAVQAIAYTITALDPHDPDAGEPVEGHDGNALEKTEVIYDTLQQDSKRWTVDDVGFNFEATLDVSSYAAFPSAGVTYRIEVVITPQSGPPVIARWESDAI